MSENGIPNDWPDTAPAPLPLPTSRDLARFQVRAPAVGHSLEETDENLPPALLQVVIALIGQWAAQTILLQLYFQKTISGYAYSYVTHGYLFVLIIHVLRKSERSASWFGFNLRRLSYNLKTSLEFGLLGAMVCAILRYFLVHYGNTEYGLVLDWWTAIECLFIYPFMVLVQEVLTKGMLQRNLVCALRKTSFGVPIAILFTSLVFAQYHLFYGYGVFAITFVFGLVSGWYFERSHSLVGVLILHYLLGCGFLFGVRLSLLTSGS